MRRPSVPAGPWLVASFVAFGALWGAWQALLPELAGATGLSSGPLGAILTVGFAASIPAMLAAGRAIDRWGTGTAAALTALALAGGVLAVATLPPLPGLVLALVLLVGASGAYDVVINAAAMADVGWSRPVRLTLLHAGFSGGGVVGALGASGLLSLGMPFRAGYLAVGLALLIVAAMAPITRWGTAHLPRAQAAPWTGRGLLALAALAGLAFLAEGSMETWAALYLRSELGTSAALGALGPAAFHAAMLTGRLLGAGVAALAGPQRTLVAAGGVLCAGMLAALASPDAGLAIGAIGLAAFGVSFVVPVVLSLVAARAPGSAGRAASQVMSLGYAGFLVGPSLIGLSAELVGLRGALLIVPAAGVLIGLGGLSRAGRRP